MKVSEEAGQSTTFCDFKYEFGLDLLGNRSLETVESEWHGMTRPAFGKTVLVVPARTDGKGMGLEDRW